MTAYAALLRAVNVGGTGKLPMADLRAMAESLGYRHVRTYIASGNVLFESDDDAAAVKAALEARLADYAGKAVPVMVRTRDALRAVLASNPFPDAAGNRVVILFLDVAPAADTLATVKGQSDERMALGPREIWVDYGAGMRDSKLQFPAMKLGTGRNRNTVEKLVAMLGSV